MKKVIQTALHRTLSNAVRLALGFLLFTGSAAATAYATDGVTLVPVFGQAKENVSDQVDWFIARAGVVEREEVSAISGKIRGYVFSTRFYEGETPGTFLGVAGEFGVKLDLPGHQVFSRVTAPEGADKVEIPVAGVGRIQFTGVDLPPDALVAIGFSSATEGGSQQLSWGQSKGFFYLPPGDVKVTFHNMTTTKETTATVTLVEGETTPFPVDTN